MWGSDRRTSQRATPQGTTAPSGAGAGGVPARPDALGALGAHGEGGARARGGPGDARDPFGDAPDRDDALDAAELEDADVDADADADAEDLEAELIRADSRGGSGGASATDPLWLRLQARKLLREFLRAVPRTEPQATISFLHPDGTARTVTRGQLATAIDRMRPRLRQIMRLSVEERWPRQRVCEYLRNISIKTFERDQAEGLDALIDGEFQGY